MACQTSILHASYCGHNLKMGIYCCDISLFRELLFSNQGRYRICEVQAWQEAAALQAAVQLHRESTGCSAIQAARSQYLRDEQPCQGSQLLFFKVCEPG